MPSCNVAYSAYQMLLSKSICTIKSAKIIILPTQKNILFDLSVMFVLFFPPYNNDTFNLNLACIYISMHYIIELLKQFVSCRFFFCFCCCYCFFFSYFFLLHLYGILDINKMVCYRQLRFFAYIFFRTEWLPTVTPKIFTQMGLELKSSCLSPNYQS